MLKAAGLVPESIALGSELEAGRARLASALDGGGREDPRVRAEAATLNRRIDDYNLKVLHAALLKPKLRV